MTDLQTQPEKKPQVVQAALKGATDWRVLAGGAAAALLLSNPIGLGVAGTVAVASAVNAGISVNNEITATKNKTVTPADKPKNGDINWGLSSAIVGGLAAAAFPILGLPTITTAVVAGIGGHLAGQQIKSAEEAELEKQKGQIAYKEKTDYFNAGAMSTIGNSQTRTIPDNTFYSQTANLQPAFQGNQLGNGFQGTITNQASQRQLAEATR